MTDIFQGKNILVTGGTGSIGSEIVRKILQYEPKVVRILDNDENGLFNLGRELNNFSNTRFLMGDIRDKERLNKAVEGTDFVFHAAALKHVPLCEYNPFETVKTNVIGTQNLLETATEEKVEKLITISTDKAVNPVNVMGATKLLAERLTISANYYKGARKTALSCVRFGNILDSRGSVVPLLREQIERGGPLTVTDPNMTRFVMSIPKAVTMVLKATEMTRGGEIFIFKMPAIRINDLAEAMIEEWAPQYGYDPAKIQIEITGKRAGEKSHEELMTGEEENAYDVDDMFVVMPEILGESLMIKKAPAREYVSEDAELLTKEQIKQMLREAPSD